VILAGGALASGSPLFNVLGARFVEKLRTTRQHFGKIGTECRCLGAAAFFHGHIGHIGRLDTKEKSALLHHSTRSGGDHAHVARDLRLNDLLHFHDFKNRKGLTTSHHIADADVDGDKRSGHRRDDRGGARRDG